MKKITIKILGITLLMAMICQQVCYAVPASLDGNRNHNDGLFAILYVHTAIAVYSALTILLLILKTIETAKGIDKNHKIIAFLQFLCGMSCFVPIIVATAAAVNYVLGVVAAVIMILIIISRIVDNEKLDKALGYICLWVPLLALLANIVAEIIYKAIK